MKERVANEPLARSNKRRGGTKGSSRSRGELGPPFASNRIRKNKGQDKRRINTEIVQSCWIRRASSLLFIARTKKKGVGQRPAGGFVSMDPV